jgi:hypothetical protein
MAKPTLIALEACHRLALIEEQKENKTQKKERKKRVKRKILLWIRPKLGVYDRKKTRI